MRGRLLTSRPSWHSSGISPRHRGPTPALSWVGQPTESLPTQHSCSWLYVALTVPGSTVVHNCHTKTYLKPSTWARKMNCVDFPRKWLPCPPLPVGLWSVFPQLLLLSPIFCPPHPFRHMAHRGGTWSILPGTTLDLALVPWHPSYNH